MTVSHIRQGKFGIDPNLSRMGYKIQVDAKENPTDDLTDGNNLNIHPARIDSNIKNARIIATLFQHFPCGLGDTQKYSLDDNDTDCSNSSWSEDNSSSNDRQRRRVHDINDQKKTALASRRMNFLMVDDGNADIMHKHNKIRSREVGLLRSIERRN